MKSKPTYYTTTRGDKVEIRPVSNVTVMEIRKATENKYRLEGFPLDPPTYEAPIGDGSRVELVPHTPATLETDEDKQAWAAYLEAQDALETEIKLVTWRYYIDDGLVFDLPQKNDWKAKFTDYGIDVPKNGKALREFYRDNVLIPSTEDYQNLIVAIMTITETAGATTDSVEAVLEKFRDTMEESKRQALAEYQG